MGIQSPNASNKPQSAMERNFLGRSFIKNQSAMEYLMTYGWAILIIAVVLVALFQMGVFNSANFAPKAQPGSCQVFKTVASTSLEGTCNNELPQYVASYTSASNSIISVGNTPTSNPMTISLWIYPIAATPGGWTGLYLRCQGYGDGLSMVNNALYFDNTNQPTNEPSTLYPTYNTWNFATLTINGDVATFYLNSDTPQSFTAASNFPNTQIDASIGSYCFSGRSFWGDIANVQVYNTSLSQNDITSLYREGIGGAPQNTQNLVGWWPLNGNANDYSGNNNNGAATNVIYTGSWTSEYSAP